MGISAVITRSPAPMLMAGYNNLLETSENYRTDVDAMNNIMQEFATLSNEIKETMDAVRMSIDAVNTAVSESAEGVNNVTTMSVELTTNVAEIGHQANNNYDIAKELNAEVGKFKI